MTTMYKLCWAMWIAGTILIAASWANFVSPTVGWIGFAVALAGTLLSFVSQQRPQLPQKQPGIAPEHQTPRAESGAAAERPRE